MKNNSTDINDIFKTATISQEYVNTLKEIKKEKVNQLIDDQKLKRGQNWSVLANQVVV